MKLRDIEQAYEIQQRRKRMLWLLQKVDELPRIQNEMVRAYLLQQIDEDTVLLRNLGVEIDP